MRSRVGNRKTASKPILPPGIGRGVLTTDPAGRITTVAYPSSASSPGDTFLAGDGTFKEPPSVAGSFDWTYDSVLGAYIDEL